MWALDTSWLVALFDEEDKHHAKAWKEAQEPGALLVNPVILVEFLEVVRRHSDRAASLEALADLERIPQIRMLPPPKPAILSRIMSRHGGISWRDASAVGTALDEGAGLRTFDDAQRKAFSAMA